MSVAPLHPTQPPTADPLDQLRSMLALLWRSNRFYAPILQQVGLDERIESLDVFRRRMPLTTKQQIAADQIESPPYGSNLTFPLAHYSRFSQTSGTTAAPLRWLDTEESWAAMIECWARVYDAAGVTADDRVYFAFSFGPFLGFWTAFEAATRRRCLAIPSGGISSLARLRAIFDNRATVLCCTPTYALHLIETARRHGIDLAGSGTRAILVAGEPGGSIPAVRHQITSNWVGAKLYDHHGLTEVGPVSYPCPVRENVLHVIESHYIAEVIDPATAAPAPQSEIGELVLTNLRRVGSPLLRYRTGDLVRARAGRCNCGTHDLSLLGGILGRADDMLVVRGVNVFPTAVDQLVRSLPDIAEYRVTVTPGESLTEIALEIEPVPERRGDALLAAALQQELRTALSLRVPVTLAEPGSLPRFEHKARRWVR